MASTSDNLYVTYVDVDRDLLKVWGQRNRIGATYIERQLLQLLPEFNRARCPNPSEIHKGMFCFAKYTDDNYYRARVISRVQNDSVGVLFVDYGNRDFIKLSNIRIQQGKDGEVLAKMSEQAEEYYLARITAPAIGWTKEIVSEIRRDICYDEFSYNITDQVGDQKILEIQFHGEDFSNYLVKKKLACPLSLPVQKHMILSYCSLVSNENKPEPILKDTQRVAFTPSVPIPSMRASFNPQKEGMMASNYGKPRPQVNFPQPPPGIHLPPQQQFNSSFQQSKPNIPKSVYFPLVQQPSAPIPVNQNPPLINTNPSVNSMINNQINPLHLVKETPSSFSCNSNIIQLLAQQVKQYIAEDNAKTEPKPENIPHHYLNSVLEVGNTYNVITSYIDDGPWSFSIQLMSSETELRELMDELSTAELVPIKPPIVLGHPCIASSALYGNLCRGVVVSISHSAVKVYFVDFGNTEDLPASSIYQLPPKFFKIRVLSQKFSLSGLQKVAYSDDIRKFFKEVVQDELLMLRVTSLEDDNLPTCELYLKSVNIKRILNEKIREQRTSTQEFFPKVGDTEEIIVTWVVSPQKFFIQLQKRDADLKALKDELSEVEAKGQRLTYPQLSVGYRCVCRYESDGHWYRAVITSVDSENAITVFYVDYGNTETVNISQLRRTDSPGLINQMSNQAIQCSLKGFENKPFDQELANKLESLVLEKELQMRVVSSEKELLCVQLLLNGQDVSSMLNAATAKLDSFDTSSSSKDEAWNPLSASSSVTAIEKEKVSDSLEFSEKKDTRNYRNDRPRVEKSGRPFSHFQSFKSAVHSTPVQSKKRHEGKENWREEKDKGKDNHWKDKSENQNSWRPRTFKNRENDRDTNGNSKLNGNRGPKQSRDDWGDRSKSRTFKSDRPRDGRDNKKEYNSGDRKKFDENRGSREGRRFERSPSRDSWRSKEDTKMKFDRNDNMINVNDKPKSLRKPIRKDEAAPPGSKFEEKVIEIGACENGIVTYYFSPDEFYVQLLTQEQEFTKMMKDIQKYYSDKYSIRDPLQAGDIVIAQFSVDKVLYRAEVIKPSPVTVCYVDYGNYEPVGPKSTWLVTKEFLNLPKQVVKCRLSNIRPTGSHWPPPGGALDKFFALSEYKCTFISKENDFYVITMLNPSGNDVASEIIAAGLGQKMAPKLDVPEIDFSLLPNQVLRLCVSYVESPSKFFVILNSKGLEVIENEIKNFTEDEKNLTRLKEDFIKPETVCLASSNGFSWQRGKIMKVDGDKITIWFCDRGDSAVVTVDKLMSLPDYLTVFQPQAVECCLHGETDIENEEDFKDTLECRHHLVSIVSESNGSLSVVLYSAEGEKYDFHKSDDLPQAIEPIGQLPVISEKFPVLISHFETPKEVYIHRFCDWDDSANFSDLLSNFYTEENDCVDVEKDAPEGTLVAAFSLTYETWYRARLVSSLGEDLEVFYIDFGNKEILPRDKVKKLDSSFLTWPAFSRKSVLDFDCDPEKLEEVKSYFSDLGDKEVIGYFKQNNGEFILEVVVDGERATHVLQSSGLALVNSPDKFSEIMPNDSTDSTLEPPPSENDNDFKVIISHIDNPKQFWVHKETLIQDLNKFQDKLKKQCEVLPEKDNVSVGDVIGVMFSDTWYRAKVAKVNGNIVKVQFIDYGNRITVDLKSDNAKELTDELLNEPVFATPFALKGIWSDKATSRFEEIILQDEDFITAVILEESDPAVVDLYQNGQSICELLKKEGFNCEDEYESVYLAHSNSPEDFFIHKDSISDIYNKLTECLADISLFSDAFSVEEGGMYVAKYPEDGGWYRAKIVRKDDDGIEAQFVDYGNTSKVTEIKCIPKDIIDVPKLAENCRLAYGENNDIWSEAACEKFAELADGRELKMKVIAKKGKKAIVELIDGESNVTKKLEPLCEDDGRSEVYVSYALSPLEFYIQYVDDEDYKLIVEKLDGEGEDIINGETGTICQARFVEDGQWYRARILRNLEEGTEVYFIDFGNVSVATEVKQLPPELENIPNRAIKCCLDLEEKNIPEIVKEEFIALAAGGATIFRALVIVPGNENVISLKYKGRLLEETLISDDHEESSLAFDSNATDFSNSEMDDGKNCKNDFNNYDTNIEDDDCESVWNETDEEKRVKFAQLDLNSKSDDEKGFINATDNELMKETLDTLEEVSEPEETQIVENGIGNENKGKSNRNKVNKIVPGCISRGEEEVIETVVQPHSKLTYSEKLVPGSISRGISYDSMANEPSEKGEEEEEKWESQSAPNSPEPQKRVDTQNYVKRDPSEKVVPGCISTGTLLHCSPVSEKIPKNDKIVSGAVNGSADHS